MTPLDQTLPKRYDLFEVEEEVGFLARMIFDPFGVDHDDPERVISYKPSGSTTMTMKGSYPTNLRGRPR
jgi:hypothetical protein